MTIIVDTNATHLLFNGNVDGTFVYEKIRSGEVIYVTGGTHKEEILKGGMPTTIFRQLQLAGRLKVYPDEVCHTFEKTEVSKLPLCSDDPHIITLAIKSGCRVLFSFDANLCKDFKNKAIIDQPRGKVFQSKKHAKLLQKVPPPL